jgi:hypothetical protein
MDRTRLRQLIPIALALILLGTMSRRGRLAYISTVDVLSLIAIGLALGIAFANLFRRR